MDKTRKQPSARERAIAWLAQREHSALQLRRKLQRLGYSLDEIETTLLDLQTRTWQSDDRFAEVRTRGLKERGAGPQKIRAELRAAGVSKQIDQANLRDDNEWTEAARLALERRYGDRPISDRADWVKRARWLASRGFTETQIRAALKPEPDTDD